MVFGRTVQLNNSFYMLNFNRDLSFQTAFSKLGNLLFRLKAAKASTELTKGDKKSVLVSGFLNNGFLPLTSLQRQYHFLIPCFKDQR